MQSAKGDCSAFAAKSEAPSRNCRPSDASPAAAPDSRPSVPPKRKRRMKFTPRRSIEEKQLLWPHAPPAGVHAPAAVNCDGVHRNQTVTDYEEQHHTEPTCMSQLQLSSRETNEVNKQLTIRHIDLVKKFTNKIKILLSTVSRLERDETVTTDYYQLLLTAVQLVVDMGRHIFLFESIEEYKSSVKQFKIEYGRVTNAFEAAQSNDILGSTVPPSLGKALGVIKKMEEIYVEAMKVRQLLDKTVVAKGTDMFSRRKSGSVSDQQISTCATSGKSLPRSVVARPGNSPPILDGTQKAQSSSGVVDKKRLAESSQTSNCANSVSSCASVTRQVPLQSGSAAFNQLRFEMPGAPQYFKPGAPQYAIRVPNPTFPYTVPHQMHLAAYGGNSSSSLRFLLQPPSQIAPNGPPPNLMSPMWNVPNSQVIVPEEHMFFENFQSNVLPLHMERHPHALSGFVTQGVFHAALSPTGSSILNQPRAESVPGRTVGNSNANAPATPEQALPPGVCSIVSGESQFEGVLPPSPEPTPDSVKGAEDSAYDHVDESSSRFNYTVQSAHVDPDSDGPFESSALPEDKRRSVEEVDSTGGVEQRPDSPLTSPRLNEEFRRLMSARNSTEDGKHKRRRSDPSKYSDEDPPIKKNRSKKSKKRKHLEMENCLESACSHDDVQTNDRARHPTGTVQSSDILSLQQIKAHRGLFHCKGCISKIEKADFFADFAFIHGRLGFPCPHCAFIGHSGTVLKSHIDNSHAAIAEHCCVFCEKSYDLDAFSQHAKIVECQRFCCPKCSFCSSKRSEYSTHYKAEHSSDGPAPVTNGTADWINIPSCVSSSRQIHQCFNTCFVDSNCQILQVLVGLQPGHIERAESEQTEAASADEIDVKPDLSQLSLSADDKLSIAQELVRKVVPENEICSEGNDQEQDEPLRKKHKSTNSDVCVDSIATELVNKFRGIFAQGVSCLLPKSTENTVVDLTSDVEDACGSKEPNFSDTRERVVAAKETVISQCPDQENKRLPSRHQTSAEGKSMLQSSVVSKASVDYSKSELSRKPGPKFTKDDLAGGESNASVDGSKSNLSRKPGPKFTKSHGAGGESKTLVADSKSQFSRKPGPKFTQRHRTSGESKISVDDSKSRLSSKPGPKLTKAHRAGEESNSSVDDSKSKLLSKPGPKFTKAHRAGEESNSSVDDSKSKLSSKPGPKLTKAHRPGEESNSSVDDSKSKLSSKPGPKFTKARHTGEESERTSTKKHGASVDAINISAEKASKIRAVNNISLKDIPPDVMIHCQHNGCKYEGKKLRMMYHLVENHSYVKNYTCSFCHEEFATSSSVINHIHENATCFNEKARPKMIRPLDELCDNILFAMKNGYRLFVKGYYFKL